MPQRELDPGAPAPRVTDGPALAAFRALLEAHDYTVAGLDRALGAEGAGLLAPDTPDVLVQRFTGRRELSPIVRLFQFGLAVPRADLGDALDPPGLSALVEMNVLRHDGDLVSATVQLSAGPQGLILAADFPTRTQAPDYVGGPAPASRTTADLTPRAPVEATLDLGTGSGMQALFASAHSRRVVAVDVLPRALDFARFNAALNGRENIDFRLGDLFEPAAGETFDLIVSNPPFVMGPPEEQPYRFNPYPRDSLVRDLIQTAPAYLRPGGYFVALANWAVDPDAGWEAPLRGWVRDTGCDAWLILYGLRGPGEYARVWAPRGGDAVEDAARLEAWLHYFDAEEIRAVAAGNVILRRRAAGAGWVRADRLPPGPIEPSGDYIRRVFEARDLLESLSDADLLALTPRPAPNHHIERIFTPRGGGGYATRATVVRVDGLGLQGEVDDNALQLLAAADGRTSIADLVAGLDTAGDPALRERALAALRSMIEYGILDPRPDAA